MRHRRRIKYFGRPDGARKALIRGLVRSLVLHGRIRTTLAKAKEVRRHVEKAVSLGKDDSVARKRLLLSRYPDPGIVKKLVGEISPRFKDRPGGYTRVIKLGTRPGDCAEMAFIEFVDFDYKTHEAIVGEPKPSGVIHKQRKRLRQIQSDSRRYNRQ